MGYAEDMPLGYQGYHNTKYDAGGTFSHLFDLHLTVNQLLSLSQYDAELNND